MKRYNEVNASVDSHIRKFKHLIPDVNRKKSELLHSILGESTYKDVMERIKQDKFKLSIGTGKPARNSMPNGKVPKYLLQ